MSYTLLPSDFVPALEAASTLAFGDDDYVRYVVKEKSSINIDELDRPRAMGDELDQACVMDNINGEKLDQACRRLMDAARHRKITMIGIRGNPEYGLRQAADPLLGARYEQIPPDFFEFNDWCFGWPGNFPIYKPGSSPFAAEWFYPAVEAGRLSEAVIRVVRPPSGERPFWPAARAVAFEWLAENGCPAAGDGNQAELERHVTGWLQEHGYEAGEASVRRHVAPWIGERRAELNR